MAYDFLLLIISLYILYTYTGYGQNMVHTRHTIIKICASVSNLIDFYDDKVIYLFFS